LRRVGFTGLETARWKSLPARFPRHGRRAGLSSPVHSSDRQPESAEERTMKTTTALHGQLWLLALALPIAASGCNKGSETDNAEKPVIAFVAASTKDAVQEIAREFTAEKKVEVKIDADDSSKLATRIVQDAPAQLFLSANEKWADYVKEKGFAQETKLLLGNSLVIVTPKNSAVTIRRPEDLAQAPLQRIAVAGPTVPAGIYARQALKNLKIWDGLEAGKRIVTGDNVRITLTYVERGEADAGIVYATDAKISDRVDLACRFPPHTHEPIRYPLVLLKAGESAPSARAFFAFLESPAAKAIFVKHGFSLITSDER
jgi:molybdate transport system substrate-binding protein